ncbi:MAG: hypothetical protein ACOYNC_00010 [Bacteroidales bacterium]
MKNGELSIGKVGEKPENEGTLNHLRVAPIVLGETPIKEISKATYPGNKANDYTH